MKSFKYVLCNQSCNTIEVTALHSCIMRNVKFFKNALRVLNYKILLEITAIVVSPISDQLKCMKPMINARNAPVRVVAASTAPLKCSEASVAPK